METNKNGFMSPIVIAVIGVVLAGVAIAVIRYRFTGPEDYWQCKEGRWVKHGVPLKPQPTGICPSAQDVDAVKRPDRIVQDFYESYVPMADAASTEAIADNTLLSQALRDKIKDMEPSAEDIFYCSTNKPSKIVASAPSVTGEDKASVRVEESFADGSTKIIAATTIWEGDAWRIDGILCDAPEAESKADAGSAGKEE